MPFGEVSVKNLSTYTRKRVDVSRSSEKHFIAGKPISEVEVAPHDTTTTSLGTYKENEQPKGFSIEYDTRIEKPELVKTEIAVDKLSNGAQYLLRITNETNRAVCVEVKVV